MLIPEHGVQPTLSLRPGLVTLANCKPVSPLDDAAKPPMYPTTSWDRFCWLQLCHLALGCKYPPFSGAVPGGREFNPFLQKHPGCISSNVFHFPLHCRPRSPEQFSAVKLFHAFHLFASSLPKTF